MELQQGVQFLNNKISKTNTVENNSNFDFSNADVNTNNGKFDIRKKTDNIMTTITDFIGINK